MRNALDILFLTVITVIGMFVIATSIPLGSPHIFAYCLLSQFGTVPVDDDAFRIFCVRSPTDSAVTRGVEGSADTRSEADLRALQRYDRFAPYFYGESRSEGEQLPDG